VKTDREKHRTCYHDPAIQHRNKEVVMRTRILAIGVLVLCVAMTVAAKDDSEQLRAEADFIEAARWGRADDVARAIEAGVDINAKDDDGIPAIRWAAVEGNATVVELLAESGADVDATDPQGVTPLMMAARWAHISTVRALVEAGADVNLMSSSEPGRTALMYAAIGGYNGVVTYLLEAGADPRIKDSKKQDAAKLAEAWGREITAELIRDFK
jgi:ankyrin repeat protein